MPTAARAGKTGRPDRGALATAAAAAAQYQGSGIHTSEVTSARGSTHVGMLKQAIVCRETVVHLVDARGRVARLEQVHSGGIGSSSSFSSNI